MCVHVAYTINADVCRLTTQCLQTSSKPGFIKSKCNNRNKGATITAKQISKQHLKICSKFLFIFILNFKFSYFPCFPPAAKTLKTRPQLLYFLEVLKLSCSLVPKLELVGNLARCMQQTTTTTMTTVRSRQPIANSRLVGSACIRVVSRRQTTGSMQHTHYHFSLEYDFWKNRAFRHRESSLNLWKCQWAT